MHCLSDYFTYTPNSDYNGNDSFIYEICDTSGQCETATVTITVTPVPDPPTVNDDTTDIPEDTSVTIDVAANDSDPDGDLDPTLTNTSCIACAEPNNGDLLNNGNGSFIYTPNANYNGDDSFIYQMCDTSGMCGTAMVTITVTPVPDPPGTNDDTAVTPEDTSVIIDVMANDNDPDGQSISVVSAPSSSVLGGAVAVNADGSFTYDPPPGFEE